MPHLYVYLFGWLVYVRVLLLLSDVVSGYHRFCFRLFFNLTTVPHNSMKSHTSSGGVLKKKIGQGFSKHPDPGTVLAPWHGQTIAGN